MGIIAAIDEVLLSDAGNFNIVTSGVDYLTIKVDQKSKGGGIVQGSLLYISRLLDWIVQGIASFIFAIYRVSKGVYLEFEKHSMQTGLEALALSPIGVIVAIFNNLKSIVVVNINNPYRFDDMTSRAQMDARQKEMAKFYPLLYGDGKQSPNKPIQPSPYKYIEQKHN